MLKRFIIFLVFIIGMTGCSKKSETIETIIKEEKINYKTIKEDDKELLKGETKVKTEGKEGYKKTVYRLVDDKEVFLNDWVYKEPVHEVVLVGTKINKAEKDLSDDRNYNEQEEVVIQNEIVKNSNENNHPISQNNKSAECVISESQKGNGGIIFKTGEEAESWAWKQLEHWSDEFWAWTDLLSKQWIGEDHRPLEGMDKVAEFETREDGTVISYKFYPDSNYKKEWSYHGFVFGTAFNSCVEEVGYWVDFY